MCDDLNIDNSNACLVNQLYKYLTKKNFVHFLSNRKITVIKLHINNIMFKETTRNIIL